MPKKLVFILICLASLFPGKIIAQAPPASSSDNDLLQDIDLFLTNGADAYIAWQYSGKKGSEVENDKYSFYEGDRICQTLQQAASTYPGKIGINVHNFSIRYQDSVFYGRLVDAINPAACGASIIRFFASDNTDAAIGALQSLNGKGVRAVVALHNFALGGQISFFNPGNYQSYKQHAVALAARIEQSGLTPLIYTLELSNEPHCGNDASCVANYKAWVDDVSAAIRAVYSGSISLGQASQVSRDSRGDSVKSSTPGHPVDFQYTNDNSNITKTSGHHYDPGSVQENMSALNISKTMGKTFYIGEAGSKVILQLKYQTIPSQNGLQNIGINNLCQFTSVLPNFWWTRYFNQEPLCHYDVDQEMGSPKITDDKALAGCSTCLDSKLVKVIDPSQTLTTSLLSINSNAHDVSAGGSTTYKYDSPAINYRFFVYHNGSGKAAGTEKSQTTLDQLNDDFFSFETGSLPRAMPYSEMDDKQLDKWLCRLAATNVANLRLDSPREESPLVDIPLNFINGGNDSDYDQAINDVAGATDRTRTVQGNPYSVIRASDIYCTRRPVCDQPVSAKCGPPLDPNSENYQIAIRKLRMQILDNQANFINKTIIENCSEWSGIKTRDRCTNEKYLTVSQDYYDLPATTRDAIYDNPVMKGNFLKWQGNTCWTCNARILYQPNFVQSAQANIKLGQWATPLSSHAKSFEYQQVVDYSSTPHQSTTFDAPVSLGQYNYRGNYIDPASFNLFSGIEAIFSLIARIPSCIIQYATEQITNPNNGQSTSQSYPTNGCSTTVSRQLRTIVYMSADAWQSYNFGSTLDYYLLPNSQAKKLQELPPDVAPIKTEITQQGNQNSLDARTLFNSGQSDAYANQPNDQKEALTAPTNQKSIDLRHLWLIPQDWQQ